MEVQSWTASCAKGVRQARTRLVSRVVPSQSCFFSPAVLDGRYFRGLGFYIHKRQVMFAAGWGGVGWRAATNVVGGGRCTFWEFLDNGGGLFGTTDEQSEICPPCETVGGLWPPLP